MKQLITVTVSGATGTGKSAISQIIQKAMSKNGIASSLQFVHDEHEPRTEERLNKITEVIKDKVSIRIIEQQTRREPHET